MRDYIQRKLDKNFPTNYLDIILAAYGIKNKTVIQLDSFENYVYLFKNQCKEFILRITKSSHRSEESIWGEMNWINSLRTKNIAVAKPIVVTGKKLVEVFKFDDCEYFCVIFEKVMGKVITLRDWNNDFFYILGKYVGKMHCISKENFSPSSHICRPNWCDEKYLNFDKYLISSQDKIINHYHNLIREIKSLPILKKSYGLIHADIHTNNFFLYNNNIILFDFDDSIYSWYIHDLAIILYSLLQKHQEFCNQKELPEMFWRNFLNGYNSESNFELYCVKYLYQFFKLREMQIYVTLHRCFNLKKLNSWESDFFRFITNSPSNNFKTFYNIDKEILIFESENK